MMKKIIFALLTLAIIGFTACNDKEDPIEEIPDNSVSVIINEMLPRNTEHGSDQDGEFDDWIEFYNTSDKNVDISGYYLSDDKNFVTKWSFPDGTSIGAKSYLIVWTDDDTTQVGLHTNFKLSATNGETVLFLTPDQEVINMVQFPPADVEQSWARKPNATGDFEWSVPTFNKSND
jgi:hypothetical protein